MAFESYSANIINDGANNFTVTLKRNPTTLASGGTDLPGTGQATLLTSTKDLGEAIQKVMTVARNDFSTRSTL